MREVTSGQSILGNALRGSFWGTTLALGLAGLVRALFHILRGPVQLDFSQFYLAASVLRAERGVSCYDPAVIERYCELLNLGQATPPNYPPLVAILFYPLSFFPYEAAKTTWLLLNISLVSACAYWGWRRLPSGRRDLRWYLLGFILLLPATTDTLLLGQINPILGLLLLTAAIGSTRRGRQWHWLAAASLGLAGAIKLWPVLLSGYFAARKRLLVALGSMAVFALLSLSSGLVVGGDVSRQYIQERVFPFALRMATSGGAQNQSIWGVAARLFRGGTSIGGRLSAENAREIEITPLWRSVPVYWVVVIAFLLVTAAVLIRLARRLPEHSDSAGEQKAFWAVLIGILTVLPFSWNHYAFFLIFPLVLLAAEEHAPGRRVLQWGTVCLLFTLIHRFWAWLPPHSLLLGFVFLALVIMEGTLLSSAAASTRSRLRPR